MQHPGTVQVCSIGVLVVLLMAPDVLARAHGLSVWFLRNLRSNKRLCQSHVELSESVCALDCKTPHHCSLVTPAFVILAVVCTHHSGL